ncbi:deoxyhypusine synthase [Desulfovibrionales bacterium]
MRNDEKIQTRDFSKFADGACHNLSPLCPIDLDAIADFDEMLRAMSTTAFGGRSLGEALDVLEAMVEDPDCLVVATISGAMTVAKMSMVLCKMIDAGWVDVVISTGAIMAHGFIESIGLKQFKYEAQMDDRTLYEQGYNRVYDTLEPEANFIEAEHILCKVLNDLDGEPFLYSEILCRAVGRYLAEKYQGCSIFKSAYAQDVPVYIPAFTDSELALDVVCHILHKIGCHDLEVPDPAILPFQFNPFLDLLSYARRVVSAKKLGIFTIGGGVPRNWAQQIGPFVEIAKQRVPGLDLPMRQFCYAVRVCPEPVHLGGLSGCTYHEGISWGKFVAPEDGGRFAEVYCDATIVWPLLVKALDQRLTKKRQR